MPITDTDAQLVAGHLAGDRSALAGIYDRFADPLYDTAAAMLRDRHDAGDVVQDVFVIAAERLGQLRDPDRLKPWLFAILRNEVYRRTGRRRKQVLTDFTDSAAEMTLPSQPADDASSAEFEELATLVRGAAAGLDERDQLVLEYSIRQGLQGDDLAAALGVSAQQSYGLVHRMRARTERSLGAYCVARAGRKDCAELAKILSGWDGEFSVLIRKRVARHVDDCETCERSRRKLAPLALFGAAPALAAPPELRDRVLGATRSAEAAYGFTAPGGFPAVVARGRRGVWLAIGLIILLLGGTAVYVTAADGEPDRLATATGSSTTTTTTTTTTTMTTTTNGAVPGAAATGDSAAATSTTDPVASTTIAATSSAPGTTAPGPTTPPSSQPTTTLSVSAPVTVGVPLSNTTTTSAPISITPPPTTGAPVTTTGTAPPTTTTPTTTSTPATTTTVPPGRLVVSAGSIDFGTTLDQASLTLTNTGGTPVDWVSTTGPAAFRGSATPYSVAPGTGTLAPGASTTVFVLIDRTWPVEGPVAPERLSFVAPGTSATVELLGEIARPPDVDTRRTPTLICAFSPTGTRNRLTAIATVTDESNPVTVRYDAVNGEGTTVAQTMTLRGGEWYASISMVGMPQFDLWTWTITATDAFGNAARATGTTEIVGTFC